MKIFMNAKATMSTITERKPNSPTTGLFAMYST